MSHERLNKMIEGTLFHTLPENERQFLETLTRKWPFSFQQFKQLTDIAKDFYMWQTLSFEDIWNTTIKIESKNITKRETKLAFEAVITLWQDMKRKPHHFSSPQLLQKQIATSKYTFSNIPNDDKILGRCPVASERTLCCNLLTLDAVRNCGFDCSYCSIQSFFKSDKILVETNLKDKLAMVDIDPEKTYHIGTGQSSDSLMWGNKEGILDDLFDFAKQHPNVILELKTKSKNIYHLLNADVPKNVICTWSLNPDNVILEEERLTATLSERLSSARKLADKGILVGFHFHPLLHFEGYLESHQKLVEQLMQMFSADEVALISMGTVTFAKSVVKKIRARDIHSKILQMPLQDADGKLSYPEDIKLKLFQSVYQPFSPWHNKVFFYLCMENQSLWEPLFGYRYSDNNQFESAMKGAYLAKIAQTQVKTPKNIAVEL